MKKTGITRKGLLTDDTIQLLKEMQEKYHQNDSAKIYQCSVNALKMKINRYLLKLGYHHTSHDFRHTKTTELANAGLPTKTMQMYVGHKNPATTMRYIHVEED